MGLEAASLCPLRSPLCETVPSFSLWAQCTSPGLVLLSYDDTWAPEHTEVKVLVPEPCCSSEVLSLPPV